MKASHIIGVILAVALIIFGTVFPVPEKQLRVSGYSDKGWMNERGSEYVGGDAYNYQMEASLKSGYMAGVVAMKTITIVGGLMLFCTTLYAGAKQSSLDKQTKLLKQISDEINKSQKHNVAQAELQLSLIDEICAELKKDDLDMEDSDSPINAST